LPSDIFNRIWAGLSVRRGDPSCVDGADIIVRRLAAQRLRTCFAALDFAAAIAQYSPALPSPASTRWCATAPTVYSTAQVRPNRVELNSPGSDLHQFRQFARPLAASIAVLYPSDDFAFASRCLAPPKTSQLASIAASFHADTPRTHWRERPAAAPLRRLRPRAALRATRLGEARVTPARISRHGLNAN